MHTWKRIIDYWKSCDLTIRPGVSPDAIAEFESQHTVLFPDTLRSYFLTVDGMEDEMDPDLYRFWPLGDVRPVANELTEVNPDRLAYPDCFVFADHCISCWDYAVKITRDLNQPAPVFRVTGDDEPGEQMADTFAEFMESYADNPLSII